MTGQRWCPTCRTWSCPAAPDAVVVTGQRITLTTVAVGEHIIPIDPPVTIGPGTYLIRMKDGRVDFEPFDAHRVTP